MRSRFIGDPARDNQGPEAVEAFGQRFRKGEWSGVDHLDAVSLRKLAGNSHFEFDASGVVAVVPEGPKKRGRPAKAEAVAPEPEAAAPVRNDDDWGDLDP